MGVKFSNNGHSTLAASITSSDTSITVASGHGARFPSLGAGDYFYATLIDASNNLEIVKCTARSSDVLTVTRGQESTTARAYAIADRIELRVTAQGITDATDIDTALPSQTSNSGKYLTTDGTNSSWGVVNQYSLPSQTGNSGKFLTTNGTSESWGDVSGLFLQIIQTVKTDTSSISSNSPTFSTISGFSATITPSSSSNKVLVIVHINASPTSGYRTFLRLQRSGAAISAALGASPGSRIPTTMSIEGAGNQGEMASMMFLDSPSTTSATAYTVGVCTESTGGNVKINAENSDGDNNSQSRSISTMTLIEVKV